MKYKNRATGVIVQPSCEVAEQSFARSKEWVKLTEQKPQAEPKPIDNMTIPKRKDNSARAAKIAEASKSGGED